ncbi:uncharacterized protein METZ01_LOCUS209340, partial [marine metagenome]
MIKLKIKIIFAFIATFIFASATSVLAQDLCEECLENVPQDMVDYVYNM